jgi:hypothetical protein
MQKFENIKYYIIDIESNRPTKSHAKSLLSSIQIQTILYKAASIVLTIEVQYLHNPIVSIFKLIQKLCNFIFYPDQTIIS